MPSRLIKESVCTSEDVDRLSWFEEVVFYRLIVNCDDFGRFDARPAILKARLFPLKDGVTAKQIEAALNKLATVGMVQVYEYDQKPFLQLPAWEKHQRVRNKESKYPAPSKMTDCGQLSADCGQLSADCGQLSADCGLNPIQSNPIRIQSESESELQDGAQDASPGSSAAPFSLPLNDGTEYPVTQADVDMWQKLYPAVDVMQELRNMKGWCIANPNKRKTLNGVVRFINGWLAKAQDNGGGNGGTSRERQKNYDLAKETERALQRFGGKS